MTTRMILVSMLWGMVAALALPWAGFNHFIYNLTPWTFPVYALAVYALYRSVFQPYPTDQNRPSSPRGRGSGIITPKAWLSIFFRPDPRLRGDDDSSSVTERFCHARQSIFLATFAWAFGYYAVGLSWVGNALLIDGNPYAWAWPLAVVGLPLLLAPFLALPMAIVAPIIARGPVAARPIAFAALWALAEMGRGYLFTGFPWNLPAYYWSETLVIFQVLSLVGPYGLSFLTILWAVMVGQLLLDRHAVPRFAGMVAVATLVLGLTYGTVRLLPSESSTHPTTSIVLVQASIPQSEKWDGARQSAHLNLHLDLSRQAAYGWNDRQPAMIVWPETALPPHFVHDPGVAAAVAGMLGAYPPGSGLVTGALVANQTPEGKTGYYNSILGFNPDGTHQILYHKSHLVPFGEYMPFQRLIPIGPIAQFENLTPGPGPTRVAVGSFPAFRPLVCYEIIFPAMTWHAQADEQFILNVTNDSWYGHSSGPYQHLAQARARAIERGLPVVRAAGNGISAGYDPRGRLLGQISYDQIGTITINVALPHKELRPFYLFVTDWGAFFALLFILISGLWHKLYNR